MSHDPPDEIFKRATALAIKAIGAKAELEVAFMPIRFRALLTEATERPSWAASSSFVADVFNSSFSSGVQSFIIINYLSC